MASRDAANISESLDTVTEMLEQLQITPKSEQKKVLKIDYKDNSLFSDRLIHLYCEIPALQANGAVVKIQNGFLGNKERLDSLNSLNCKTRANSSINKVLRESVLSEVLNNKIDILGSNTSIPSKSSALKTISSSSVTQQNGMSKPIKSVPIFLCKDDKPVCLPNSTIVTQKKYQSPITSIEKISADSLTNIAVSSKTSLSTFDTVQSNSIEDKTTTVESNAEKTMPILLSCENTKYVFNKKALMSMFDGSRNLFTETPIVQKDISIDKKAQTSSFPFRDKFAASLRLQSRISLHSQKWLQNNSHIKSTKFEMNLPTFCKAQPNFTTMYVFGAQDNPETTMFDQASPSQSIITNLKFSFGKAENSKHQFNIGVSPKNASKKSPAKQQITRPSRRLQKYNINLYNNYKDYKSALSMFGDAILLCPNHYIFYAIRAHYYMKLEMFREAVQDLQKVISYDHNFTEGYVWLAKCYIALGNMSAADFAISKACELEGENAAATVSDLRVLHFELMGAFTTGNYERALTSADHFLEQCSSDNVKATKAKCLALLGRTEQALKIADECLQSNYIEPEVLYAKGLCLYYSCKFQQAVEYFQKVLEDFPLHFAAIDSLEKATKLIRLAEERRKACNEGDYEKAIILNKEAIATDKLNKEYNVKLHCNIAVMFSKLNKTNSAIEACTAALQLDKDNVAALRSRAKCYTLLGQYEDAVTDYKKVCKIKNSEVNEQLLKEAMENLEDYKSMVAYIKDLVQLRIFMTAQRKADECLQIRSSDVDVLYCKVLCFYYTEQYEDAMEYLEKILDIECSNTRAHKLVETIKSIKVTIEKGDDLFKLGQWVDARRKYMKAVIIDYEHKNLLFRLHCKIAETYLKTNEILMAVDEYTRALTQNMCIEVLHKRAECYEELGGLKDAINDYQHIYDMAHCEETKRRTDKLISTLKQKEACRKKLQESEFLLESYKTEGHIFNLDHALKLAEECLQIDSSDTKAICVKGFCLYHMEQYEDAMEYLQKVETFFPFMDKPAFMLVEKIKSIKVTIEKGDDLFNLGQWVDARSKYMEAVNIDYQLSRNLLCRLHCKIAETYLKTNQIFMAVEEYTSALTQKMCKEVLRKRAECYEELGKLKNAINDYQHIYDIAHCEETKRRMDKLTSTLKQKEACRKKLQESEFLLESYKTEGHIFNLDHALKLAEECLQIDSSDTKAICVKGFCFYHMYEYRQALNMFEQVLRLEPAHSTAPAEAKKIGIIIRTIDKGDDAFKKGEWQHALNSYNEALKLEAGNININIELYHKKAATLKLMGGSHLNEAITLCTLILKNHVNQPKTHILRAECYCETKRYEEAIDDYARIYEKDQSEFIKLRLNEARTALEEQNNRLVLEKVELGNKLYKREKFREALAKYKEAIKIKPYTAELYGNTYSCYLRLSMLNEALIDARKAINLDVLSGKGVGVAKCYLALGELTNAERAITKASDAGRDCTEDRRSLETQQRLHANAQKYIEEQNYERAVVCMDQCLQSSPFSSKVKLIKAECLAMLGKVEQALIIADECIRLHKYDIEALYVKGLCLYYNERHEQALKYFKEVLRLSPDHSKATATYKKAKSLHEMKEQGNEEFRMCRWQKAMNLYNQALAVDPTHFKLNAKLHFNKAQTYCKLNQIKMAADECTAALELDANYARALTLRAECFTSLGEFDCVIDDYEQLYKMNPSKDIKTLLDKAKRSQREKLQHRNYYYVLGLNRSASKSEITKAYRKLSLIHHPDRHSGKSNFERKRQERRFKEVLEAYTVLNDPVKRRKYDARDHKAWSDNNDTSDSD